MEEFDRFLSEIIAFLNAKLENEGDRVKRITLNLEVDLETYKRLMLLEVMNSVYIDAQFAMPPHSLYTPEQVKENALQILTRKLERDERLYATEVV